MDGSGIDAVILAQVALTLKRPHNVRLLGLGADGDLANGMYADGITGNGRNRADPVTTDQANGEP